MNGLAVAITAVGGVCFVLLLLSHWRERRIAAEALRTRRLAGDVAVLDFAAVSAELAPARELRAGRHRLALPPPAPPADVWARHQAIQAEVDWQFAKQRVAERFAWQAMVESHVHQMRVLTESLS